LTTGQKNSHFYSLQQTRTAATTAAHDQHLHELILRIAGNDAVVQSFAKTHCHLHLFRLNFQQPFGVQTITEHRAIVDALVARDKVGARRAMTAHLEIARSRLLDRM
jgi:DNA-binding GntR family transcriptional regulator